MATDSRVKIGFSDQTFDVLNAIPDCMGGLSAKSNYMIRVGDFMLKETLKDSGLTFNEIVICMAAQMGFAFDMNLPPQLMGKALVANVYDDLIQSVLDEFNIESIRVLETDYPELNKTLHMGSRIDTYRKIKSLGEAVWFALAHMAWRYHAMGDETERAKLLFVLAWSAPNGLAEKYRSLAKFKQQFDFIRLGECSLELPVFDKSMVDTMIEELGLTLTLTEAERKLVYRFEGAFGLATKGDGTKEYCGLVLSSTGNSLINAGINPNKYRRFLSNQMSGLYMDEEWTIISAGEFIEAICDGRAFIIDGRGIYIQVAQGGENQ